MSVKLYAQYCRELECTPLSGPFADYGWYELPHCMDASLMVYETMLGEFAIETSNEINALVDYTRRLAAWERVIRPLDVMKKHEALLEFVSPLATLAMNLPYVIRSRLIFATVHLCHQANQVLDGTAWKDDLPDDEKIDFRHADQYGRQWRAYGTLKRALEKISARDYRAATSDFRNKYTHRIAPRIGLGLSELVKRSRDPRTGGITYAFGQTEPLQTATIVSLLSEQSSLCHSAHVKFKALVGEQIEAIKRSGLAQSQ